DAWSDQVLSLHNSNRVDYGAAPLTWISSLYPNTQSYAAQCKFEHSSGGAYGENLAAGTGSFGISNAMTLWMNEADNNPGFSSATGHFTQVVWKTTTQVACAIADCPAGTIFGQASKYVVCRYSPPGNVLGQFPCVYFYLLRIYVVINLLHMQPKRWTTRVKNGTPEMSICDIFIG
ncbi:CAP domain-containing protein, partial [Crucibulum laeve]